MHSDGQRWGENINNEHAQEYWVSSAHIWRREIQSHSFANRKPCSSPDFFGFFHKILSLRICWQFHYQHFHFSNPSPICILIKSPGFQLFEIYDFSPFSVSPKAELDSQSKYVVLLILYLPTVFLCHLSTKLWIKYSLTSEVCSMLWRKQKLTRLIFARLCHLSTKHWFKYSLRSVQWSEENKNFQHIANTSW